MNSPGNTCPSRAARGVASAALAVGCALAADPGGAATITVTGDVARVSAIADSCSVPVDGGEPFCPRRASEDMGSLLLERLAASAFGGTGGLAGVLNTSARAGRDGAVFSVYADAMANFRRLEPTACGWREGLCTLGSFTLSSSASWTLDFLVAGSDATLQRSGGMTNPRLLDRTTGEFLGFGAGPLALTDGHAYRLTADVATLLTRNPEFLIDRVTLDFGSATLAVPEPATFTLFAGALAILVAGRRRRD